MVNQALFDLDGKPRHALAHLKASPCNLRGTYSVRSIGVSNAFFKSIKRDYVNVSILPNAQERLSQMSKWMDDYSENHPHLALMISWQREFIRASKQTA